LRRLLALILIAVCLQAADRPAAQTQTTVIRGSGIVPPRQGPAFFEQLAAAYAAGDRDVLAKTLVDGKGIIEFHYSLSAALKLESDPKTSHPWGRARSAFLLEVAVFASTHFRQDAVPSISAGRLMMMKRPALLGLDPVEDAFELLWHRTALAVLQRLMAGDAEQIYLDTLERRYLAGPSSLAAKRVFDPRFVLDRVIADEQSAFQVESLASGQAMTTRLTVLVKPTDKSKLATLLRHGVKSSEEAIALPEVAIEASLRRSALLIKLGQFSDALTAIERVKRSDADQVQRYWMTLLDARALHELKRLPEAERAYRDAADAWPDASAPITGLALVLFDMNRRDEALKAAAALRTQDPTGKDPWWNYIVADSRFVNSWRDQLREMLK
jgi:tetratricopeptide (TPR) repeat protein